MRLPRTAILACLALACRQPAGPGDSGPPPATWDDPFDGDEASVILEMSPLAAPPADPTNAWADDPDAAWLGRWLFYDARFSADGKVACLTCHNPVLGFSDGERVAVGEGTSDRKAPSLWNAAYNRWMFWDGSADTFWAQALHPLEDPQEMGFDRLAAIHLFADDPALSEAYAAVFGPLPDVSDLARFPAHARPIPLDPGNPLNAAWDAMSPGDQDAVDLFLSRFGKALEAYERTLITRHAPVDDFVAAYRDGDVAELQRWSDEQPDFLVGAKIFAGTGNCHLCHLGPAFSNEEFHNIGLGPRDWLPAVDRGRFDGIPAVLGDAFNAAGPYSDDPAAGADKLDHVVQTGENLGQFKTPCLRNVALFPPYMHGGHFDALADVVDYYSALDETPTQGHREDLMKPLDLTEDEKAGVVAFLESLTGDDTAGVAVTPPSSPIP